MKRWIPEKEYGLLPAVENSSIPCCLNRFTHRRLFAALCGLPDTGGLVRLCRFLRRFDHDSSFFGEDSPCRGIGDESKASSLQSSQPASDLLRHYIAPQKSAIKRFWNTNRQCLHSKRCCSIPITKVPPMADPSGRGGLLQE